MGARSPVGWRPWQCIFPAFVLVSIRRGQDTGRDQPLGGSCALNQIQSHFSSWKTAALGAQGSLGRIQIRSRRRRQDGNRALPPWHLLNPIGTSQIQHQMEPVFSIPWQTVFSREFGAGISVVLCHQPLVLTLLEV